MHGSVVRSWLLELAVRAFKANGQDLDAPQGLGRGLRRGPLDGPGGDRQGRPGAGHHALAADPVPLAPGRLLRRQGARRAAQRVRRPRGQDRVGDGAAQPRRRDPPAAAPATRCPRTMRDCAATESKRKAPREPARREPAPRGPPPRARPGPGDLRPVRRHRRPRPPQGHPGALPALADAPAAARVHARRRRPPPVHGRGVPRRAQGLARHVLARPARGPRDVGRARRADRLPPGRLRRPGALPGPRRTGWTRSTRSAAPAATGSSTSPRQPSAVRGDRRGSWAAWASTTSATRAAGGGSSSRSRSAATSTPRSASTARSARSSASGRSTASTTTWARRRSGTCWSSGSATASSSRSGTAATSTTCRSPWPSRSASRAAARSTRRPAPAATSSRTTCSSC